MDPNFFMHETDQKALATLKAIPGFAQLFKVFIKNWGGTAVSYLKYVHQSAYQ